MPKSRTRRCKSKSRSYRRKSKSCRRSYKKRKSCRRSYKKSRSMSRGKSVRSSLYRSPRAVYKKYGQHLDCASRSKSTCGLEPNCKYSYGRSQCIAKPFVRQGELRAPLGAGALQEIKDLIQSKIQTETRDSFLKFYKKELEKVNMLMAKYPQY